MARRSTLTGESTPLGLGGSGALGDLGFTSGGAGPGAISRGPGMRMRLKRVSGLTAKGVLKQPFDFPCPPLEEWTISGTFSHTDYDTVGEGQFSRPGGRQLATWSFDTLIPDDGPSWTVSTGYESKHAMVEALRAVRDSGSPIHFLATHQFRPGGADADDFPIELDTDCTLREVAVTERAGEVDARYLSLSFVEYRDPIVSADGRKGKRDFPVTITMKKDKTYRGINTKDEPLSLAVIAKYVYGDPGAGSKIGPKLKPPIKNWGASTPLYKMPKFKDGGKIICPEIKGLRAD